MKNILATISVIFLLFAGACSKPESSSGLPGNTYYAGSGHWSYDGLYDSVTSCIYDTASHAMTASDYISTSSNYTTIRCGFQSKLTAGSYMVVPTTTTYGPGQMSFEIDNGLQGTGGGLNFFSTGIGNQTVNVSISGGRITITGSGISVYAPVNNPTSADTSTLALNITAVKY